MDLVQKDWEVTGRGRIEQRSDRFSPTKTVETLPDLVSGKSDQVTFEILPSPIPANQPFTLILLGVVAGIVVDHFAVIPVFTSGGIACSLFFCSAVILRFQWLTRLPVFRQVTSGLLIFGWVGLGAAWHHLYYGLYSENEVGLFIHREASPVTLCGHVSERPDFFPPGESGPLDIAGQESRTQFSLTVSGLVQGNEWIQANGRIRVSLRGELRSLLVGDEVMISGWLGRPREKTSPTGFCPREYFRSRRIQALLSVQHKQNIRKTGRVAPRFFLLRGLHRISNYCGDVIDRHHSAGSAVLIRAMLLGERSRVSQSIQERFLLSGTMHLLAISGLHVGILAGGWLFVMHCSGWSPKASSLLTIVFVSTYCLLVGARPPVLRATILVVVCCLAKISGRQPVSTNSLCLAGLTVVILNPTALFQPGPQLSFVAVATLIMVGERFTQFSHAIDPLDLFLLRKRTRYQKWRDKLVNGCRTSLVGSLGIWITTLPLVAENFHVIAPIGVLANIILMVPIILLLNACFLLIMLGSLGCGWPLATFTECLLGLIHGTLRWAASVPFGHWWTFGLGVAWLLIFYLVFAFFFVWIRNRLRFRWQAGFALGWLALALSISQYQQIARTGLRVTFIDVGHGSGVLIEYPNGNSVLYDAGSLTSSRMAEQRISELLWSRKIGYLDTVIISHADLDHFNAVPGILKRFPVGRILVSSRMNQVAGGDSIESLKTEIAARGLSLQSVNAGWKLKFDSTCRTLLLHPDTDFVGKSDNADSLVLLLEYQGVSILLTGDVEQDGLDDLVNRRLGPVDILMCPHHGSGRTDQTAIVNWARPGYVVISSSSKRLDQQVVELFERHHAEVFVTGRNGAVTFEVTSGGIGVMPFHPN